MRKSAKGWIGELSGIILFPIMLLVATVVGLLHLALIRFMLLAFVAIVANWIVGHAVLAGIAAMKWFILREPFATTWEDEATKERCLLGTLVLSIPFLIWLIVQSTRSEYWN